MGEVNVGNLKKGMVLSSDVKDANGRFILAKGTEIEAKHIRIMKMWGITSADIDGVDQAKVAIDEISHIAPELLPKIRRYIDSSFCNPGEECEHYVIREIKHLCLLRVSEALSNGMKEAELEVPPKKEVPQNMYENMVQENRLTVDEVVRKSDQLASFPDIYYKIVKVLKDPRSSAAHLADVVRSDPGLCATLLKLVNSVFYGLPAKVNSITRAIALIGGKELNTLAMGLSVIRHFEDIPTHYIDMKKFWVHSIATGVFARILGHRKVGLSEEDLFIAGLLHDVGRLVMMLELPKTFNNIIELSHAERIALFEVEEEVLGYDHAKVAGVLLEHWNFPEALIQMIRYHHYPLHSRLPLESCIIYVANIMASALKFGESGDIFIPHFEKKIWDTIELSPSVLRDSLKQAERQVSEIMSTFAPR
ncbi:MAG: HDOD domain-containing protein [bacterium]|nr:HDOD domain-containing protein [bacterium]